MALRSSFLLRYALGCALVLSLVWSAHLLVAWRSLGHTHARLHDAATALGRASASASAAASASSPASASAASLHNVDAAAAAAAAAAADDDDGKRLAGAVERLSERFDRLERALLLRANVSTRRDDDAATAAVDERVHVDAVASSSSPRSPQPFVFSAPFRRQPALSADDLRFHTAHYVDPAQNRSVGRELLVEPADLARFRKRRVSIGMWQGAGGWAGYGSRTLRTPNYLGREVHKDDCPGLDACSLFTVSPEGGGTLRADAVLFEPVVWQYYDWRRKSLELPLRAPGQHFVTSSYEQHVYFALQATAQWRSTMTMNVTYDQRGSVVPWTHVCDWGTHATSLLDDLRRPLDWSTKSDERVAVFMATNCYGGGASARTAYVAALIAAGVAVDSFGQCLHNTDFPRSMQRPIYADHGQSMENKIAMFARYKFVFAFENNNITDYVTEKIWQAYQAGAVPVYMGSPTVGEWVPAYDSLLRTDQFESPAALAAELRRLAGDRAAYERMFEWRRRDFLDSFYQKYRQCAFFNSECRLCQYIASIDRRSPDPTRPLSLADVERLRARRRAHDDDDAPPPRSDDGVAPALDIVDDAPMRDDERDDERDADVVHARRSSTLTSARYEKALALRGGGAVTIDDDAGALLFDNSAFTIALWARGRRLNDERLIDRNVAGTLKGLNFDVVQTDGVPFLRLCCSSGCVSGVRPLKVDRWYWVAVTFDGTHVRFYVNGRLDSAERVWFPITGVPRELRLPLRIGAAANALESNAFDGEIDEVSLWRAPLAERTLRQMMFSKLRGDERALLAYYSFDDDDGDDSAGARRSRTFVADRSGNRRHGALTGAGAQVIQAPTRQMHFTDCG